MLYTVTYVHFKPHLADFFVERDISDKSCRENQNSHFVSINLFRKIAPFMR